MGWEGAWSMGWAYEVIYKVRTIVESRHIGIDVATSKLLNLSHNFSAVFKVIKHFIEKLKNLWYDV